MLRNLRTQRFLGIPFRGVRGSAIPGSGTHGASVMYDDIDPVVEANDEFRFRLTSSLAGFFMYEDGSFTFTPPADGTYTVTGVLMKNGADVGPETITLQSGVAGVTVGCSIGNAAATGLPATIRRDLTIACVAGAASASGARATLTTGAALTIACSIGNAAATGRQATITLAPRGPMSFIPSISRTLKLRVAPDIFEGGGFWDLTDPKRPVGPKDPDSVIDITLDWTDVLVDLGGDTIARVDYLVYGGLTDEGHYAEGALTSVFVGAGTDPEMEITFRATTASVPPRVLDRTVVLRKEEQ